MGHTGAYGLSIFVKNRGRFGNESERYGDLFISVPETGQIIRTAEGNGWRVGGI